MLPGVVLPLALPRKAGNYPAADIQVVLYIFALLGRRFLDGTLNKIIILFAVRSQEHVLF